MGESLTTAYDYHAAKSGKPPPTLNGTLYRNGPGLFDRDGYRKRHLLDGDGMIQAFDFADGRVRNRNRFVRTEKFVEESRAGAFLYPTWTTLALSWMDNVPAIPTVSQAGVMPVMWHGLNAYDSDAEIFATFVAYGEPDHFVGKDPMFAAIMTGRHGASALQGTVRRYRVNVARRTVTEETISAEQSYEFPIVDPRRSLHDNSYGYFVASTADDRLLHRVARIDLENGGVVSCDFGLDRHIGEPNFVPRSGPDEAAGWLLTAGLDGTTGTAFFGHFAGR